MPKISDFMEKHFKHFNARETLDAARAWVELSNRGGEMLLAMERGVYAGEIDLAPRTADGADTDAFVVAEDIPEGRGRSGAFVQFIIDFSTLLLILQLTLSSSDL